MSLFFSLIRGTIESIFSIGIDGPQLKNNTGVMEVRDSDDGDFQITRGKDPVGPNDYVTKHHFDVNNGVVTNGLAYAKLSIGAGGGTVTSTGAIPDNAVVRECVLDVTAAYDAGTTLLVRRTGGSPTVMNAVDNDLTTPDVYHVPQITFWGSLGAGTVDVVVSGAPVAGSAVVYIGYVSPTDIA